MRQSQPYECPWADEEIELFRDMVTRFLDTEMAPEDEAARKRGHVGHEIWRRAGELNLLCSDIPEEYGGAGGDFRHEAVFLEEMARRGLTGMNTGVHSIVAHYLLNHGTAEQRERYLPRMARGELVGAIAMSEPDAGSDLQAIRTRAVADGDHYRLSGAKTWISNAGIADFYTVFARTDDTGSAKGISCFIVECIEC